MVKEQDEKAEDTPKWGPPERPVTFCGPIQVDIGMCKGNMDLFNVKFLYDQCAMPQCEDCWLTLITNLGRGKKPEYLIRKVTPTICSKAVGSGKMSCVEAALSVVRQYVKGKEDETP